MANNYDAGEAFAAGDEAEPRFDNDALLTLYARLEDLIPERRLRLRVFRAVVAAIWERR
jgi:hypothetical protein